LQRGQEDHHGPAHAPDVHQDEGRNHLDLIVYPEEFGQADELEQIVEQAKIRIEKPQPEHRNCHGWRDGRKVEQRAKE